MHGGSTGGLRTSKCSYLVAINVSERGEYDGERRLTLVASGLGLAVNMRLHWGDRFTVRVVGPRCVNTE